MAPSKDKGPDQLGGHESDGSSDPTQMVPQHEIPSNQSRHYEHEESDEPELAVTTGDELHSRFQYFLGDILGRGGFGAVFEASVSTFEDSPAMAAPMPSRVAIKVFVPPEGMDTDTLFRRELSSLISFTSERIPRIYDWGIVDHCAFVAMELIEGGSLYERIARQDRLSIKEAWHLLEDVLSVLVDAHRKNINHLDIKPANVLIGGDGRFFLTDFGISRGNYVPSTVVQAGLGTTGYRAPEQEHYNDAKIGVQTDLYGLGATVWSALTGINLSNKSIAEWIGCRDPEQTFLSLGEVRTDAPEDLAKIVSHLLEKDPEERPGSAAEVLSWVHESISGEPSQTGVDLVALRRPNEDQEIDAIIDGVIDPVWSRVFKSRRYDERIICYRDGDVICDQGESSYFALILLRGRVIIEFNGREVGEETREGTFIGEVATLTGLKRTATMKADGDVWACVLNPSQLERMVLADPAIGIRLIKSMAERLANDRIRETEKEG